MPPSSGAGPPGMPRGNSDLKVKLQRIDPDQNTPSKITVFETIFKKLNCQLTKLIPIETGFIAITDSSKSRDTLTSTRGISELKKINLTPTESREQQANKTLFIKRVDSVAGSHTPDEIKAELQQNHPWLEIVNVYKIKQFTHIFKIVCLTTAIADRVLENGLLLYYTRIAPSQITREKFIPIKTCFKCYKVNDHDTANCTSTQTKCSNCSQIGHTHTQCTATEKTCLNCPPPNNKHSTMFHSCPYRLQQQKITEQQKQQKSIAKTQATYKDIVKTTLEETKTPSQQLTLTQDTHLTLAACVIEAHISAFLNLGNYNTLLQENIKKNLDIIVQFPNRSPPEMLGMINKLTTEHTRNNPDTANIPAPQLPPKPQRESRKRDTSLPKPNIRQPMDTDTEPTDTSNLDTWHKVDRRQRTTSDTTKNKRKLHTSPLQVAPSEIHIYKLYTDTTPIPPNPPQEWYMDQFRKGKFKFVIKHDRYQEICEALEQEKPPFQLHTDSIRIINDKDFNKLDNIVGWPASQTTQQGKKQHK